MPSWIGMQTCYQLQYWELDEYVESDVMDVHIDAWLKIDSAAWSPTFKVLIQRNWVWAFEEHPLNHSSWRAWREVVSPWDKVKLSIVAWSISVWLGSVKEVYLKMYDINSWESLWRLLSAVSSGRPNAVSWDIKRFAKIWETYSVSLVKNSANTSFSCSRIFTNLPSWLSVTDLTNECKLSWRPSVSDKWVWKFTYNDWGTINYIHEIYLTVWDHNPEQYWLSFNSARFYISPAFWRADTCADLNCEVTCSNPDTCSDACSGDLRTGRRRSACNIATDNSCIYVWTEVWSSFGDCSVKCWEWVQAKEVYCMKGDWTRVDDDLCPGSKPTWSVRACFNEDARCRCWNEDTVWKDYTMVDDNGQTYWTFPISWNSWYQCWLKRNLRCDNNSPCLVKHNEAAWLCSALWMSVPTKADFEKLAEVTNRSLFVNVWNNDSHPVSVWTSSLWTSQTNLPNHRYTNSSFDRYLIAEISDQRVNWNQWFDFNPIDVRVASKNVTCVWDDATISIWRVINEIPQKNPEFIDVTKSFDCNWRQPLIVWYCNTRFVANSRGDIDVESNPVYITLVGWTVGDISCRGWTNATSSTPATEFTSCVKDTRWCSWGNNRDEFCETRNRNGEVIRSGLQ